MVLSDKAVGSIIMVGLSVLFFYYSFWVLIIPLIDEDNPLQAFFPDRYIALVAPLLVGWTVLMLTTAFIGVVLIRSNNKSKLA